MNNAEKKQILAAAGRIFSDKGFHQARMDEIIDDALDRFDRVFRNIEGVAL